MKAKVYFSRTITPEMVVALCEKTGKKLPGKVAVKLHTGEVGNQNFIKPVFWKPAVEMVHGTVVECNTAYGGERDTTEQHIRTLEKHGWTKMFTVDLLDAEGPDMELSIPNGKRIKKNFVGKDLANYDSMLVLAHFKGHPRGGYGGALKQLSVKAAFHRNRFFRRKSLYPRGRRAGEDLDVRAGCVPGIHGRRRVLDRGLF